MTVTTLEELHAQLELVVSPEVSLEAATLAFYRFRKAMEEPDFAKLRFTCSCYDQENNPNDIFDEIEAGVPAEAEPTPEEIAETFPEQPSHLAEAVTRSNGPDYWDLAKRRTLHFGKYGRKDPEGPRTFFWVYENDPGWLEWALDETEQFDSATTAMVCHMLDR